VKLGDFLQINPKVKMVRKESYPFVEMKDLDPSIRTVKSKYSKEFSGSGSKFESGDTLLARITPCLQNGKTSQYRGAESAAWGSTEFIVLRGIDGKSDNTFIYYFSKSSAFRSHAIQNMVGSSGRQRVPNDAVENYECELPSLQDQKAIAHILGTLDDKIELNQKMNQTLEDIAKAIFKSWFVDFDPVRAKAEGRPTGLPPEISDLFPDELVDSEIGEIPKGWILSAFDDLVEEYIDNRGKTPPTENSGIPLVEIKHIYPNSLFPNLNTDKYVSKDTLESWFRKYVKKYDVLISTVGTIGLTSIVFNEEFAIAQNILGFRFKNESLSTFMFCMIKSMYFQNQINARLIETVQKSIKRKDLNTIPVLVPDENLIGRFFNIVNPLIERSYNNSCQNEVLSELRDTLLPKLISGELRIPDAEKFLEEAGI